MNRLGSAKSGAELYHHTAAALTQERRGDQAITIEGMILVQLCKYASELLQNNLIEVQIYLQSYPCWLLVYMSVYVYQDVHGYTAAQLYTHHHLLISISGKSTSSYNVHKCIIWKRRSKWRVCHTTVSARKMFLFLLQYLKTYVSLAEHELYITEKKTGASK